MSLSEPARPSTGMNSGVSMRQELLDLLGKRGADAYGGEQVTQLQHALQCAALAEAEDAEDTLVAAALLHDVGHLIGHDDDTIEGYAARGIDTVHEDLGAAWLERWFDLPVTEPVRLHVAAKRYLCATDPDYRAGLSEASQRSLELQGGPFTAEQAADWIARPYAADAVRLRHWDDTGKDPDTATPPLEHYLPLLERVHRRG